MIQTWLLKLGVYLLRQPKFGKWCKLEDKKYSVIKAIEQAEGDLPLFLSEYVSIALIIPVKLEKAYWKDTLQAFFKIHGVTVPKKILPLVSKYYDKKNKKDPWDYSGRLWFFYSYIIAAAFGWDAKKISNLPVDDALAYIQEILTEEQLKKEFVWQTSELAYPVDKATKKAKFHPWPRPYWMLPTVDEKQPIKTVPIKKSLLPVGNVINRYEEIKEAKKIKPL